LQLFENYFEQDLTRNS